jgi:tetratricopeptide (TPR) repeat protein
MKKLITFSLFIIIFFPLHGQDLVKRIALQICSCIDTIENMDSLEAKLNRCVPESISAIWGNEDEDEENIFFDSDTVQKTMDEVISQLAYYCPKIKDFILADKEKQFYKNSGSASANEFYIAGNKAFKTEDYKTSEKQYLKAIKSDPGWVYPYDNLGLTYRNLKDYKKAVKYYNKSLGIYPEGSFALQNQAVAFTYLKDYVSALENYDKLMNLYPDNPEGFFGAAKIYLVTEDYENALDYAFYTHKMYAAQESDYVKDTERLIALIHDKMKEQNKLDIFIEKAKNQGITINQY